MSGCQKYLVAIGHIQLISVEREKKWKNILCTARITLRARHIAALSQPSAQHGRDFYFPMFC